MPFQPVEDIPNIDTSHIDAVKLDAQMREVIRAFRFAIKQNTRYKSEWRGFLEDQLSVYNTTHNSIRLLVGRALKESYYPLIADAASLTREQIEKIYVLSLFIQDPTKWFRQYIRSAWRKDYENFRLMSEEYATNLRFQDYLQRYAENLEGRRYHRERNTRKRIIVVSNRAKRVVEYNWNNPGRSKPGWLKRKGSVRDFLSNYFDYPTPGKAIKYIRSRPLKPFLYRWYREYQYWSDYTHISLGKVVLQHMFQYKSMDMAEKNKIEGRKQAERVLVTSYSALASACTILSSILPNTYGGNEQLKNYWESLYNFALFPKALWEIYAKDILN